MTGRDQLIIQVLQSCSVLVLATALALCQPKRHVGWFGRTVTTLQEVCSHSNQLTSTSESWGVNGHNKLITTIVVLQFRGCLVEDC